MRRDPVRPHAARTPRTLRPAAAGPIVVLALLAGAACEGDFFVPEFNNPTLDCSPGEGGAVCELPPNPSRAQLAAAAVGVHIASRLNIADYVRDLAIIGREGYDLDGADPRFVSEMLQGVLDPGSRAFGGDHWYEPYAAIRTANILLNALPDATTVTDVEKEAIRGYAKTFQAVDLLYVVNTHDTNGAVIDTDVPIGSLPPIVGRDETLAAISTLLDEAAAHLSAGGDTFPFALTSGFAGFDTPATFRQVNRALKARVELYRGNFSEALAALNESFFVSCGSFDLGAYYTHSTDAGDVGNEVFEDPLADPNLRAHPSLDEFAQTQPGGELDQRFLDKIVVVPPKTQQDHTSDLAFTIYESASSPIPFIRNEELILIHAEASIGLGDVATAAADLNCLREQVGGLAARNDLSAANVVDELLYNRTFSLLLEGGHRWLDYRRLGRLGDLPIDIPGLDVIHQRYPIPRDETLPRQ